VIAFLKSLLSRWWAACGSVAPASQPERKLDNLHDRDESVSPPTRPAVGRRWVYVCCADLRDPQTTLRRVRRICRAVAAAGEVPIAPHMYLPAFLDLPGDHARSLAIRFELISACHELRVYGRTVTLEMWREIDHAVALGLSVCFVELAS
jgi:hypothetical protein